MRAVSASSTDHKLDLLRRFSTNSTLVSTPEAFSYSSFAPDRRSTTFHGGFRPWAHLLPAIGCVGTSPALVERTPLPEKGAARTPPQNRNVQNVSHQQRWSKKADIAGPGGPRPVPQSPALSFRLTCVSGRSGLCPGVSPVPFPQRARVIPQAQFRKAELNGGRGLCPVDWQIERARHRVATVPPHPCFTTWESRALWGSEGGVEKKTIPWCCPYRASPEQPGTETITGGRALFGPQNPLHLGGGRLFVVAANHRRRSQLRRQRIWMRGHAAPSSR